MNAASFCIDFSQKGAQMFIAWLWMEEMAHVLYVKAKVVPKIRSCAGLSLMPTQPIEVVFPNLFKMTGESIIETISEKADAQCVLSQHNLSLDKLHLQCRHEDIVSILKFIQSKHM